jgi:hypothetical protein
MGGTRLPVALAPRRTVVFSRRTPLNDFRSHAWGPPTTIEDEEDQTVPAGKRLEWTPAVCRLIREALDPIEVLDALRNRLHPSAWSGSLADKLSSRLPLLEALANESDRRISDWANEQIPKFKEEIEKTRVWEAQIDRKRDEKFEW